jgi:hypothetical protein
MNVLLATGSNDDATYEQWARWNHFLDDCRVRIRQGTTDASNAAAALRAIAHEFLGLIGQNSHACHAWNPAGGCAGEQDGSGQP